MSVYETSPTNIIQSKDKKIKELIDIVTQYEAQITILNNQVITLTKNNKELKGAIIDMSTTYDKACKEEKQAKETISNDLQCTKEKYESKIKELINIINQYSEEIEKINNELRVTQNNYYELNEEYQKQGEFLNEVTNEIQILNQENNQYKVQIQQMNQRLIDYDKEVYELQRQMNLYLNDISQLDNEIKQKDTKYSNFISKVNKDIEIITNLILNSEGTVNELSKEINYDNLIKVINQEKKTMLENVQKEIQENKKTKEEYESSIKELNMKLQDTKSNVLKKNEELNEKQNEIKEKQLSLDSFNSFFNKLQCIFHYDNTLSLEEQLKHIEDTVIDCTSKKKEIDTLSNEMKALKKRYDACVTDKELKAIQIANMEKIIEKKNELFEMIKKENSKLQCDIQKLYLDNSKLVNLRK